VYKRPRHNKIARVLDAFDPDLLARTEAFFGGGTAITLSLDEYRESVDVDFLCASRDGFSELRSRVFSGGLPALLKPGHSLNETRDLKRDMYGIRSWIDVDGTPVKMEIVSEGRIDLEGSMDAKFGVPTLSRDDMYAEKLLANADRGDDPATRHRDMIDLGMMIARWGPIPEKARAKADAAYRGKASEAFDRQSAALRTGDRLADCARNLDIDPDTTEEIMTALGGPVQQTKTQRRGFSLDD